MTSERLSTLTGKVIFQDGKDSPGAIFSQKFFYNLSTENQLVGADQPLSFNP